MTMLLSRRAGRNRPRPLMAVDVMTPNPKSIDQSATVRDTANSLHGHGLHTAPVIDGAGRPIGVVSRTNLLDYWDRRDRLGVAVPEAQIDSALPNAGAPGDQLSVQDIMTPVVFSVPMNAPIAKIIHKILALEVRNLFVTDEVGVLVGSISVFDLLRALSEGKVLGVGKGESQWKTDY
jgi:CBS-domain-containing membrane protein